MAASYAGSVSATLADADGNLYLAGHFTGTASFGSTQPVSGEGSDVFVMELGNESVCVGAAGRRGR